MNGDDKPIEQQVRDHAEYLRSHTERLQNVEKALGEIVKSVRSFHERMSKSQEFYLRDSRLNAEELKEIMATVMTSIKAELLVVKKETIEIDKRTKILEVFRVRVQTTGKIIKWASSLSAGGGLIGWLALRALEYSDKIVHHTDKIVK